MNDHDETRSTFAVLLQHIARAWRRRVDDALAPFNLSEATATALVHLYRLGGGIRQVDLAESLGIEGPSLVRLLDQLCGSGLVTRSEDSQDRRAKSLHLTEAGQAAAARVEVAIAAVRDRLLANVVDDDLRASLRVLRHLETAVGRNTLPPARGEP